MGITDDPTRVASGGMLDEDGSIVGGTAVASGGMIEDTQEGAVVDAPTLSSVIDNEDQDSVTAVVVSDSEDYTIQLYYRLRYATSWTTGESRTGSGSIIQTGLTAGNWYEFYAAISDDDYVSGPSAVKTCKVIEASTTYDPPSAVIREYIADTLSLMTNPSDGLSWPMYIAVLPESDNSEIDAGAVFDTPGVGDGRISRTGEFIKHDGIQIMVRSNVYETGYNKIENIAKGIDEASYETVLRNDNEYTLLSATRTSPSLYLGHEAGTSRYHLFSVNFIVTIRKE